MHLLTIFWLLAAFPCQWKDLLNVQGSQENPTSKLTIDKLNCKDPYNLIINRKNLPPPTAEKRLSVVMMQANGALSTLYPSV